MFPEQRSTELSGLPIASSNRNNEPRKEHAKTMEHKLFASHIPSAPRLGSFASCVVVAPYLSP